MDEQMDKQADKPTNSQMYKQDKVVTCIAWGKLFSKVGDSYCFNLSYLFLLRKDDAVF